MVSKNCRYTYRCESHLFRQREKVFISFYRHFIPRCPRHHFTIAKHFGKYGIKLLKNQPVKFELFVIIFIDGVNTGCSQCKHPSGCLRQIRNARWDEAGGLQDLSIIKGRHNCVIIDILKSETQCPLRHVKFLRTKRQPASKELLRPS